MKIVGDVSFLIKTVPFPVKNVVKIIRNVSFLTENTAQIIIKTRQKFYI